MMGNNRGGRRCKSHDLDIDAAAAALISSWSKEKNNAFGVVNLKNAQCQYALSAATQFRCFTRRTAKPMTVLWAKACG